MALTNQLCRVTVVAPNTRMDIALPDHVRLCDLQSDLLSHAAEGPGGDDLLDDGADAGGWVLTRLGGAPLDPQLTPRQHDIVDGEELYLVPVTDTGPQAVFDDIIDAMATANQKRERKWRTGSSRRFGIGFAIAAILGSAVACVASGTTVAMWTATALCATALLAALIFARALGRVTEAAVMGLLACGYALAAGVLALAPLATIADVSAPRLMVGGAAVAVIAVASGIGVPTAAPIFSATAICGTALAGAAALCAFVDAAPAQAGSVAAAVVLGLIPAMPMLAFRVARLPMPTIPRSPQQLRADTNIVDSQMALRRSERADEHLSGLLTATAIISGTATVYLALHGTLAAILLASLLTVLAFMRARIFPTVRQRLPFLLAATAGLAGLALSAWVHWPPEYRFVLLVAGLVATAAIALGYVLGVAGKPIAPTWGRLVDILEVILFVAVVPLTLWVWDAYWWVRTVNG
ncbi:type VII secretion integral membrane protein EccD [Stackebrandtia nassauensis]|uniref:Secretion protein snm4 n=1 Tax=Stackebrandtia nassauensis (strain DSM 44728 / CIP 108903 / NRRL B-16338 / NBRC 102104 / LLR-40K-21) TaxID=446470 RepID=D3Q4G3_STANL|nr:type VII secretion integral membrane protein EccD [Stackebrandtia nassauensis]ADD40123.1 secretion protein snm4 [Stackebrandtia nassauensis DSM 44728]